MLQSFKAYNDVKRPGPSWFQGVNVANLVPNVGSGVHRFRPFNGDICSIQDSARALEQSGADGVMIGRGAYGRPWLLAQVMHWLKTGQELADPDLDAQFDLVLEHYRWMLDHYGEHTGVRMARKHLAWYTRGLSGSAAFRNKINFIDGSDEVVRELREFYDPFLSRAAA
mgnify:CR=1 FL=1